MGMAGDGTRCPPCPPLSPHLLGRWPLFFQPQRVTASVVKPRLDCPDTLLLSDRLFWAHYTRARFSGQSPFPASTCKFLKGTNCSFNLCHLRTKYNAWHLADIRMSIFVEQINVWARTVSKLDYPTDFRASSERGGSPQIIWKDFDMW